MKNCSNKQCMQVNPQSLEAFSKKARNSDGLQKECKSCVSHYKRKYKEKLGAELLEVKRLSYHKHKHKRKYTEESRRKCNEYKRSHKEQIAITRKTYTEENREYIRERSNKYILKRRENDICFKLAGNLRARLRQALNRNSKVGSAVTDLGCSIKEFKQYIESRFLDGMSWDNYGKWELDHIFPLSKVDLTNREELLKVCHYTNYQPLWELDNIIKYNKIP